MNKRHLFIGSAFSAILLILISVLICVFVGATKKTYMDERRETLAHEASESLGSRIELNTKETLANQKLLRVKAREYDDGLHDVANFVPYGHFFDTKSRIEQSPLFKLIKKLPKGASLHTHLPAAVSFDYLFNNLTYEPNLYGCILRNDRLKLKFFPKDRQDDLCRWELIENLRMKNESYNDWMKEQLTLVVKNPREIYDNAATVWTKFNGIFSTLYDLISYKPVFERYIYQVLLELTEDNVFYVEFRGVPMPIYDLSLSTYDADYFFTTFIKAINNFKRDRPHFIGAKFIYSPYRNVTVQKFQAHVEEYLTLKEKYPDVVVGFDLVGSEDRGPALKDFLPVLLNYTVNYLLFHAGETNWYGTDIDENLADAILLNSSRIAHAYALVKHPFLAKLLCERDIAIEVCPISNQVLMLVDDFRNHPAGALVANGFPIVVCNDDPGYFGTKGLNYDWYVFFMAMTSRQSDLRLLKQLALNSIKYSLMNEKEKQTAQHLWDLSWSTFIDDLLLN